MPDTENRRSRRNLLSRLIAACALAALVGLLAVASSGHPALAVAAGARPTVAILYFDYGGKNEELAALRKGLAQMMITDLAGLPAVTVVERARLNEILDELKLGRSAKLDPATAARVGKLLGAKMLVLGSFFDLLGSLRIDARVVEVETGKVLLSTGGSGKLDDFMTIEQTLASALRDGLQRAASASATPASPATPRRGALTARAAAQYGGALDALDQKDAVKARKELHAVLEQNPEFRLAAADLDAVDRVDPAMRGARPVAPTTAPADHPSEAAQSRRYYALLLATNHYEKAKDGGKGWPDLERPVADAKRLEGLLKNYGFDTQLLVDPSLEEMVSAIGRLAEKECGGGEALVFLAGHGDRKEQWGEGYLVARDSVRGQEGHTSYLPHSRLRELLDNFRCEHVLAVIDACHSGTFDTYLSSGHGGKGGSRGDLGAAKEMSRDEYVKRQLEFRTRRFITSGRDYLVPDDSNFAKRFAEVLETRGGPDGVLTLAELEDHISRVTPAPHMGFFGSDRLGGFLFLAR